MTGRCAVCGACGPVHLHHVTGRLGPCFGYLDPRLVVALCAACHSHEHVAVRRAGMEWPTPDDLLAHRLARVADHVLRCADAGRGVVLGMESTRALGALLLDAVPVLGRSREVAS